MPTTWDAFPPTQKICGVPLTVRTPQAMLFTLLSGRVEGMGEVGAGYVSTATSNEVEASIRSEVVSRGPHGTDGW